MPGSAALSAECTPPARRCTADIYFLSGQKSAQQGRTTGSGHGCVCLRSSARCAHMPPRGAHILGVRSEGTSAEIRGPWPRSTSVNSVHEDRGLRLTTSRRTRARKLFESRTQSGAHRSFLISKCLSASQMFVTLWHKCRRRQALLLRRVRLGWKK